MPVTHTFAYWLPKVYRCQQGVWIADVTFDSKSRSKYLKSVYMACNANTFRCKRFIFGTLIVYGLQITKKVLDCWYDIVDKGQGRTVSYYVVYYVRSNICDGPSHRLTPSSLVFRINYMYHIYILYA